MVYEDERGFFAVFVMSGRVQISIQKSPWWGQREERYMQSTMKKKREEKQKKGWGGEGFLPKIAWWGVAGNVPRCCVQRHRKRAYWEEAKEKVLERGWKVHLRVLGVWKWEYFCHGFLGMKMTKSEIRNIWAQKKNGSENFVDQKLITVFTEMPSGFVGIWLTGVKKSSASKVKTAKLQPLNFAKDFLREV